MQIKSLLVSLFAAVSVLAQAADPSINTPTGVTECLPVQLTFSGTEPPFIITVQPGGQAGAAPLTTVGTTSANAITWNVNLPAGTDCTLVIRDNLGRTNPSAEFTILANPNGCATSAAAGATTGAAGATTTPAGAATTTPAAVTTPAAATTTPAASVTPVTQSAASVVSSASAAAATTKKSGAFSNQPICLAGLMGLVGVAALM